MRTRSIITMIVFVLVLTVTVVAAPPPDYQIERHVIGGGGAHAEGGTYGLVFTLGQPLVESHSSGDTGLGAGFWARALEVAVTFHLHMPVVLR